MILQEAEIVKAAAPNPADYPLGSPESRAAARAMYAARNAAHARNDSLIADAMSDPYLWATSHTKTFNEQWREEGRPSPYEPFPDWPYLKPLFRLLQHERIIWLEKSRDLLLTWSCMAYLTWEAMRTPHCGVLAQCQKEEKAIQLIDYAKCLYRMQDPEIQEAYPLAKPIDQQSSRELEFAHGGYIFGIPGGASQIRSYHPWGYLLDEASFVVEAGESYNEALSAVAGKVIPNSSAGPGWFSDVRHDVVRIED